MRYIDKYQFAQQAHDINVKFLQDCYQGGCMPMLPRVDDPDLSYEDFKKRIYRFGENGQSGWQNLLMQEQESRCCYCMRKLEQTKLNIEHVVPRTLSGVRGQKEYADYSSYAPAIRDFVMIADEFAQKSFDNLDAIAHEMKMPHITAEANLLAACNGKRGAVNTGCCCNNTRKDNFIRPIMLMQDCDQHVDYDELGILSVLPYEDSLAKILEELNDETFQQIRKIWYRLSGTTYTVSQIESLTEYVDRVILFKQAFSVSNFEEDLSDEIKKYAGILGNPQRDFYWNLLLSYDWFFTFYRNKRANQG